MICPACHYPDPSAVCPACGAVLDTAAQAPVPVGRSRTLALLDARLDEVLRMDRPHLVGVVGAAGTGRTTLMNAFARRRANAFSRVRTLRGFADGADPWCPLGRLVHVACGLDARWPPARRRREARERLAALLPAAPERALRALEAMLAPPGPGATMDPVVLEDAFLRFLEAHLERAPLLVLLEHCAAASDRTLAVLDALRTRGKGAVLVLCELDTHAAADRFSERLDEVVPVEPLEAAAIADLLGALADRAPAPEPIVDAVLAATGGHVASVCEAGRTLLAAGAAPAGTADWILPAPLPPLTAGQASRRRIESLAPGARHLLAAAALLGPGFHAADVPALHPDVDLSPEGVAGALAAAVQAGLLSPLGDGLRWRFTTATDRAALRAELPEELVIAGELQAAWAALARDGAAAGHAVAGHLDAAGRGQAAAVWWLEVGLRAWQAGEAAAGPALAAAVAGLASAPPAARLGALEAALTHALQTGAEVEAEALAHQLAAAAEAVDAFALMGFARLALGQLALARGDADAAEGAFIAARMLCKLGQEPARAAQAVAGLGDVERARGRAGRAEAAYTDALERFAAESDRAGAAAVLVSVAALRRCRGAEVEALQALDAALGWAASPAVRLAERMERAEVLAALGRLDEATTVLAEAEDLAVGAPVRQRARLAALTGLVAALARDAHTAEAQLGAAAWLAEPLCDSSVRVLLARAEALRDAEARPAQALARLEEGLRLAREHRLTMELAAGLRLAVSLHVALAGVDLFGGEVTTLGAGRVHLEAARVAAEEALPLLADLEDVRGVRWGERALTAMEKLLATEEAS